MTMKILRISESSSVSLPKSSRSDSPFAACDCFDMFHSLFSRTFYKIGYLVGKYPSYFIIIPFFISVLGLTGFQRIKFERDSDYLFIPSDGNSKLTRQTIEELFPSNSSQLFDISRITKATNFAKLYISAKDGGTMFRRKIWKEVVLLDDLIQNMTVEWDGKQYKYKEICSKWYGDCYSNNIYNLNELIPEVEDQVMWISYPIMIFPFVLPMFFGGVEFNQTEGIMVSAKALFTTYWVSQDDWKQIERGHLWEGKLLELLDTTDFETIIVDRFVSRSIPDELEKNNKELMNYLPYALLLLIGFSVASVMSFDWVRSKVQMVFLAVCTIIMAICSSFGLLMYVGTPFIGINTAAPFLILGIGLDDMFIILSAWNKTRIQDTVANRLASTYKATAVSITVTSLTNMVAFFIGTLTTFPGVRIFCTYLGVSVAFTYLWFITFFGACLAVVGHQEKNQRHSLFCWKVKPKSESENSWSCYRLLCSGGVSKSNPSSPVDNKPCRLSTFFKNSFASGLNRRVIKGSVILLYSIYLGGAIYGCCHIKEGLDPKSLAVDNSYLARFYDMENEFFRNFPYRIQVVIKGNLTYSEKETKRNIMQLHRALENLTYVGPRLYTKSWLRSFLGLLERKPDIRKDIKDEVSFISTLQEKYIKPTMKESLDVVYNEDKTRILASRFIIQGYHVKDLEEDKEMIRAIRKVAQDSPLDVSLYHPTFVYYDQYLLVMKTTTKAIAVAAFIMMVVSFVFIPSPLSSMWVGISILSIQVGVIGYVSLWDARLDSVSMVNLIMSIGFSVDFSAHIVYAYVTSKFNTPEERLRECLYNMGPPIVQSGISTVLGVILFILVPSYIYRTFFKIIFLVTIFGMMHALLVLPCMLSLTSQRLCKVKENNNTRMVKSISTAEPKSCFTNFSTDILKDEEEIQNKLQRKDSCFESSSFSRESSLSESKSVKSESLRSSEESSGQCSDIETTGKRNECFVDQHQNMEIEHL